MEATGGISLKYNDGNVLASGEKLSYFRLDKRAIVEGDAIGGDCREGVFCKHYHNIPG